MCKKFLLGAVFSMAIFLTACSQGWGAATETSVGSASGTMSESVSETKTSTAALSETSATTAVEVTEKTSEAETEEAAELIEHKYKIMLEKYINCMKNEYSYLLKNVVKCRIYLQDVYGDDTLEMAVCVSYQSGNSGEFFFAADESGDVQLIGVCSNTHDTKFYSDGEENYIISKLLYENKIPALKIYRLGDNPYAICCDAYEYSNSSAEEFIENTQLTFCRYDYWFDEGNDVPAEVCAKDFYYEDTETYDAYMLSRYLLELTGVELSEYRAPYNTIPIDGYLAKRDEYSAVMERLENMMTELDIVPEFDSGWINAVGLNLWLKNLKTTTDITETKSEAETEDTRIIDPIAAVEKYLRELAESENVTAVELRETRIGQSNTIVDKYYDDPHAEELGITFENDLRDLTAVNVDYSIEYAENSDLESGEKSDYFIVKSDENGFYVIDTFPYEPKYYYGNVKEILTDENGDIDYYTAELDDGLGTVKCNNAVLYPDAQKFEIGERIRIYANGDVYGDPPRLDALSIIGEDELESAE